MKWNAAGLPAFQSRRRNLGTPSFALSVFLVNVQHTRPVRERGVNQCLHFRPAQSAIARRDARHCNRADASLIGSVTKGTECRFNDGIGCTSARPRLRAEVEHARLALFTPRSEEHT